MRRKQAMRVGMNIKPQRIVAASNVAAGRSLGLSRRPAAPRESPARRFRTSLPPRWPFVFSLRAEQF